MTKKYKDDFIEQFSIIYPEQVDGEKIQIMKNGDEFIFNDYSSNLRENALYTATYGQSIKAQCYHDIGSEEILYNKRKTDFTIKDLDGKVFGIIENGITSSQDPTTIINKKIAQSLNYIFDYDKEGKLSKKAETFHLTINVYNPDIFLSNKKNFVSYMDSNKDMNYIDVFKTYGMHSFTFIYSLDDLNDLFDKMNHQHIQEDFVIKHKDGYFPLKTKFNVMSYLYLDNGKVIPNNDIEITNNSFSYNYLRDECTTGSLNRLYIRSLQRGGSKFNNSRLLDNQKAMKKRDRMIKTFAQRLLNNDFNIQGNEEIFDIGWNAREISGSLTNTNIFFNEEKNKVLICSPDVTLNNGQHSTFGFILLQQIAIKSFEEFKEEVIKIYPGITKIFSIEDNYKKLQLLIKKVNPKLNFTFYGNEKNGQMNTEINNDIEGQTQLNRKSFKYRENLTIILTEIEKQNLYPDLLLFNGASFHQEPKYHNNELQSKDIGELNILFNSYMDGKTVLSKPLEKDILNKLIKLKEKVKIGELTMSENSPETLVIMKKIISVSGKSQNYRSKYEEFLKEHLKSNISNKQKIMDLIASEIEDLETRQYNQTKNDIYIKELKEELKINIKDDFIRGLLDKVVTTVEFQDELPINFSKTLLNKIANYDTKIEIESLKDLLAIDLWIDSLKKKQYSKIFSEVDTLKTFIGYVLGVKGLDLNLDNAMMIFNQLLNNLKDNSEGDLNIAGLRNKNITTFDSVEQEAYELIFKDMGLNSEITKFLKQTKVLNNTMKKKKLKTA